MALKLTPLETQSNHIHVLVTPVGPLKCNCTLIYNSLTLEAVIIDAGGDADELLKWLRTYAHFDHFLASEALRKATGCPLFLHKKDLFLWDMLETQCQLFGFPLHQEKTLPPDDFIKDGQTLDLDDLGTHQTLVTPGHTPGSCCFHLESQGILVAGDTLFHGGIGRTDLWGGDESAIYRSITQRLHVLDVDTTVVTGHGKLTTIQQERHYFN
jgi:glyoxylase-like metal-dependent hydrolase (beta-lactamase superfamily II)